MKVSARKKVSNWIFKKFPILRHSILWPPGHYYSPIPSLKEIRKNEEMIFDKEAELRAINLNEAGQLELLDELKKYYDEIPFEPQKKEAIRYYFNNEFFSYGDGIFLYCLIRHIKPQRIIEIGSGFSSTVILDTNEIFFNNQIYCTFIEPYPKRFESLIKPSDLKNLNLIQSKLQDVELSVFKELGDKDFLFIDSTHVSKTNSDVNYLVFKILPSLHPGVYIHFHDIPYPFEYTKERVYLGFAWNEVYLLRAFLEYNNGFKIVLFNSFIGYKHYNKLAKDFPLCTKGIGASIWLRKVI